jgi:hypothetical protein
MVTKSGQSIDMASLVWSIVETTFATPPTLTNGTQPKIIWVAADTKAMKKGKYALRLAYTRPDGQTKALRDLWINAL